jgi:hypothetical protein
VSALSIPIGGEWHNSSADFNPNHNHVNADFNPNHNHVNADPKQASLQNTSRPHHHATAKQNYHM